ncbi:MAG: ABC transporter permease, partial [Gemmatimonadaceae bacterium]
MPENDGRIPLNPMSARRKARARSGLGLDDVAHDVRYAVRGLARRPGFTAIAALCLAIGIGSNAAMFGAVDELLFRSPAGVRDPGSLAWLSLKVRGNDGLATFTYPDYLDFERPPGAPPLAAYTFTTGSVGRGTAVQDVNILVATHAFMSVLGATLARGRFFTASDEEPDAPRVAVLGYAFWQNEFGGRTDVIGQTVRVGTKPYTVIGIAPERFNGVERTHVDVYVPPTYLVDQANASWPLTERRRHWAKLLVRMRPATHRDRVAAEFTSIYRTAVPADSFRAQERVIAAAPGAMATMDQRQVQNAKVSLWLYGVAAAVLLIACGNVAGLLLIRATSRRREIAIRLAMGISRMRLARLLVTESLLLAALGCTGGLLLASIASGILRATLLSGIDPGAAFIDGRVLSVTLVTTVLAGLMCGLAPVAVATRPDLVSALKSGEREGRRARGRTNSVLLVGQVALTFVLLIGAAAFVRSVQHLDAIDYGLDASHVLRARLTAHSDTPAAANQYFFE